MGVTVHSKHFQSQNVGEKSHIERFHARVVHGLCAFLTRYTCRPTLSLRLCVHTRVHTYLWPSSV